MCGYWSLRVHGPVVLSFDSVYLELVGRVPGLDDPETRSTFVVVTNGWSLKPRRGGWGVDTKTWVDRRGEGAPVTGVLSSRLGHRPGPVSRDPGRRVSVTREDGRLGLKGLSAGFGGSPSSVFPVRESESRFLGLTCGRPLVWW